MHRSFHRVHRVPPRISTTRSGVSHVRMASSASTPPPSSSSSSSPSSTEKKKPTVRDWLFDDDHASPSRLEDKELAKKISDALEIAASFKKNVADFTKSTAHFASISPSHPDYKLRAEELEEQADDIAQEFLALRPQMSKTLDACLLPPQLETRECQLLLRTSIQLRGTMHDFQAAAKVARKMIEKNTQKEK